MKKTAVVILNYNGRKFLNDFLPGVIEKSVKDADVWVADNCSTDDSVDLLKNKFPNVSLILNKANTGYAGGYNEALNAIRSKAYRYYILLNSDIEVSTDWVKPLEGLMEANDDIAACQPKILSFYEKGKFEYAGGSGGFIDKYGYPFCRGRLFQSLENDKGQYDDEREVFWASGACMMVRSDVFHDHNGFDADFFAHMEEIDLCWRMKNSAYRIMVCPSSTVFHVGGGTLPKKSSRKTYLNFRNNFSLLYKNLPQDELLKVFILRLFLDGVAGIKFLFQAGFSDTCAVIKAHFYFYRNSGKLKQKRKKLKQRHLSMIYRGNIVFEHYILRKRRFDELKDDSLSPHSGRLNAAKDGTH